MNTMDYSILVKDMETRKKIALRQKIKNIIFWATLPLLLVIMLFNSFENLFLNLTILGILMAELCYNIYFFYFVSKCRKAQTTSLENEDDRIFIELNDAYDVHFALVRKLIIITTAIALISFISFSALLTISIIIESEALLIVSVVFFFIFFIAILASTLAIMFKQMSFAKKFLDKIEQARKYCYAQEGLTPQQIAKKKRNLFNNAADNQKILSYMYPDEAIRGKVQKLVFLLIIPMMIVGGAAGGVGAVAFIDKNFTLLYTTIAVGLFGVIGTIVAYAVSLYRLTKKQRTIFEAQPERYKYHLELADQTKKYQKKSTITVVIITIAVVLIAVALRIFASSAIDILGVIFLSLVAWFIALVLFTVFSYKPYRAKAKTIEEKIEEHENNYLSQAKQNTFFI